MQVDSLNNINKIHFIGVAGVGMSAIAQYLSADNKTITGSDRYFTTDSTNETKKQLEAEGIKCFLQDGSGIDEETQLVVISTAIEDSNIEIQKANVLQIPIIKRAELLSIILDTKRGIAIAGTSGKSTTTAMLFDILEYAGKDPSIISGAGLVRLQEQGKIGNAKKGNGDILVIEADESDGSIINYYPEIGVLLNIEKDHKELKELRKIFKIFKSHCRKFIVNHTNTIVGKYSQNKLQDFGINRNLSGYRARKFVQEGLTISFEINDVPFTLNAIGKHNMENALAASCVASQLGVSLQTCSEALAKYKGIYRRNQVLGKKNNVWIIDDYAHNPAKVHAAIASVQPLAQKVIAWFQPHGYGPTRFLRDDFVESISQVLRLQDEIWMSEIFYAGGSAIKDISANDLIEDLKKKGTQAFFVADRTQLMKELRCHFTNDCVLLLMGARDPSLDEFAKSIYQEI